MDSTRKPISLILNSSTIGAFGMETISHSATRTPTAAPSKARVPLIRRLTPSTRSTRARTAVNNLESIELPILIAINESKSMSPKVGICIIDPNTSKLTITEIVDSQTYVRTVHKINMYSMHKVDIIVPLSFSKPTKTNLMKILEQNLIDDTRLMLVPKNLFRSEAAGKSLLLENVTDSDKSFLSTELNQRHFALCATCAAINYMKQRKDNLFIHEKFNVSYEASESTAFIDMNTVKSLELIENNVDPKKGLSLLKFLDSTMTKMGHRLLRSNILQPLTNGPSLTARFEAVQELMNKEGTLLEVHEHMNFCADLDKLFSFLSKKPKETIDVVSDQKINNVILLKQSMTMCRQLGADLSSCTSNLLVKVRETFQHPDVAATLQLIKQNINEDCSWANRPIELRNQQCYAVKSGMNGLLDASRQLHNSLIEDILTIADDLGAKHELAIEAKFDTNRGFHLKIKENAANMINELPPVFINRTRKNRFINCTTLEIAKLNSRMENAYSEILIMSGQTVDELLSNCKNFVSTYFMISEATALLDLICGFAANAEKHGNYVKPEFSSSTMIRQARHPILETLVKKKFVANDIVAMPETSRMQIITGPNMSGKSVYLSQIPLISIMAQIGSFVPASYAKLAIYRSIYARISNDTDKPNMSSFSSEMSEMAFILNNADKDSLIIIDELGRASSYTDGFAISLASLEHLVELRSICFMCTHFTDLPKVMHLKQGVLEQYMKCEQEETNPRSASGKTRLKMNFELTKGVNWISGYGISMVRSTGTFPQSVIKDAEDISELIKVSKKKKFQSSVGQLNGIRKRNIILDVYQTLQEVVRRKDMTDDELLGTLQAIECTSVERLSKLIGTSVNDDDDETEDESDGDGENSDLLAHKTTETGDLYVSDHNKNVQNGNVKLIDEEEYLLDFGSA
ncbi:unnamed protein product [Ambrosiozyma monospora]|uniref:Unnamed protein product n=1 Tax=Ambrosiozyma monospora TaxID=43982 RepID=A0A9W6YRA1_AMBMO|nr:unnamed protein product [Ambrosiozyma monospora]